MVAAPKLQSFYMHRALCRLALFPNVTIIPIVSEPQDISSAFRSGQPSDYLPRLSPNDVVYASAAPALTERVTRIARAAGAEYHVEPFVTHAELHVALGRMTGKSSAHSRRAPSYCHSHIRSPGNRLACFTQAAN